MISRFGEKSSSVGRASISVTSEFSAEHRWQTQPNDGQRDNDDLRAANFNRSDLSESKMRFRPADIASLCAGRVPHAIINMSALSIWEG